MGRFILRPTHTPKLNKKYHEFVVRRITELLNEGYTLQESLKLILPLYMTITTDEITSLLVECDFSLFRFLSALGFSKLNLFPLLVANSVEDTVNSLKSIEKYIEMEADAKKKLKEAVVYPAALFVMLLGVLFLFRKYLQPNLQQLISGYSRSSKNSSFEIFQVFLYIPDVVFSSFVVLIALLIIVLFVMSKLSVEKKITIILKLPIIKTIFIALWSRSFSLLLGTLLMSGNSVKESFRVMTTFEEQPFIAYIATNVHDALLNGMSLHIAVKLNGYLSTTLSDTLSYGEKNGYVEKELVLYSKRLTEKMDEKIKKYIALVQPILFTIIAVTILGTYLSMLLPMYRIIDTI